MGLGDYPNFLSPNERHLHHVPRKDPRMSNRNGPHVPRLLELLAKRIEGLGLNPSELDSLWVGDSEDPLEDLRDALIDLAGDIAADNADFDDEGGE